MPLFHYLNVSLSGKRGRKRRGGEIAKGEERENGHPSLLFLQTLSPDRGEEEKKKEEGRES